MKHVLFAAAAAISAVSYGGFWGAVNRVQKTVDTVNAVGDLIRGGDSSTQSQPVQPAQAPATVPVSVPAAPAPAVPTVAAPAPAVDVSFVTALPKLKSLSLRGTTVVNGSAVAALPKTVRVGTDKTTQGL